MPSSRRFQREGRYGRIMGIIRDEKRNRVTITQSYSGCTCTDSCVRTAGTGHKLPPRCPTHDTPWFMVRTDPIEEDD